MLYICNCLNSSYWYPQKTFFEKTAEKRIKRQMLGFVLDIRHPPLAALWAGPGWFPDGVLKGHQQLPYRVSAWLHNRTKLRRVKITAISSVCFRELGQPSWTKLHDRTSHYVAGEAQESNPNCRLLCGCVRISVLVNRKKGGKVYFLI